MEWTAGFADAASRSAHHFLNDSFLVKGIQSTNVNPPVQTTLLGYHNYFQGLSSFTSSCPTPRCTALSVWSLFIGLWPVLYGEKQVHMTKHGSFPVGWAVHGPPSTMEPKRSSLEFSTVVSTAFIHSKHPRRGILGVLCKCLTEGTGGTSPSPSAQTQSSGHHQSSWLWESSHFFWSALACGGRY